MCPISPSGFSTTGNWVCLFICHLSGTDPRVWEMLGRDEGRERGPRDFEKNRKDNLKRLVDQGGRQRLGQGRQHGYQWASGRKNRETTLGSTVGGGGEGKITEREGWERSEIVSLGVIRRLPGAAGIIREVGEADTRIRNREKYWDWVPVAMA